MTNLDFYIQVASWPIHAWNGAEVSAMIQLSNLSSHAFKYPIFSKQSISLNPTTTYLNIKRKEVTGD